MSKSLRVLKRFTPAACREPCVLVDCAGFHSSHSGDLQKMFAAGRLLRGMGNITTYDVGGKGYADLIPLLYADVVDGSLARSPNRAEVSGSQLRSCVGLCCCIRVPSFVEFDLARAGSGEGMLSLPHGPLM